MFTYNASWPQELQEAERRRYRAACRVRCLESSLDRIDPGEFDQVMDQLEASAAGYEVIRLRVKWAAEQTQK